MQKRDIKIKAGRYERVYEQIKQLLEATSHPVSRMSTISALLHFKMEGFFWTGFYFLHDGELIVGPYQGPVACLKLERNKGVCWAGINSGESVVVEDVHQFPGHIACSSLSNSEIVVPVRNLDGDVIAVLDVDSREYSNFDEVDRVHLERITALIYE